MMALRSTCPRATSDLDVRPGGVVHDWMNWSPAVASVTSPKRMTIEGDHNSSIIDEHREGRPPPGRRRRGGRWGGGHGATPSLPCPAPKRGFRHMVVSGPRRKRLTGGRRLCRLRAPSNASGNASPACSSASRTPALCRPGWGGRHGGHQRVRPGERRLGHLHDRRRRQGDGTRRLRAVDRAAAEARRGGRLAVGGPRQRRVQGSHVHTIPDPAS